MSDSSKMLDSFLDQGVKPKQSFGRRNSEKSKLVKSETKGDAKNKQTASAPIGQGSRGKADTDLVPSAIVLNDKQNRLLVRAMISAAKADGNFDQKEQAEILHRFENLDSDDMSFVKNELAQPLDINSLANEIMASGIASEAFAVSLSAIDLDTPEEEHYLDDLAKLLDLNADEVSKLKERASNKEIGREQNERSLGSMNEWYFSVDGNQKGPLHYQLAVQFARLNQNALCWRDGFESWLPVKDVDDLKLFDQAIYKYAGKETSSDEIDFKIFGNDIQFVEVELEKDESLIGEAGALMYKDSRIELETIFGDGRKQKAGLLEKMVSAGERVLTGESLFLTLFSNNTADKTRVAFAAPYPGTIIPLKLSQYGNKVICQKDCFLAAAKGVRIGVYFQKRIFAAVLGGEGFIMQMLEGDGWAFVHAGGAVIERDLAPGESLDVETGSVVSFTDTVTLDVRTAGGLKTLVFGGEGLFLSRRTGPGKVWLQSMPVLKLASRLMAFMPRTKVGV